ncbi:hypothetical protein [Caudoviricetes sp.]|nr:hypothetical protein [Caudoviricetes sp.]
MNLVYSLRVPCTGLHNSTGGTARPKRKGQALSKPHSLGSACTSLWCRRPSAAAVSFPPIPT